MVVALPSNSRVPFADPLTLLHCFYAAFHLSIALWKLRAACNVVEFIGTHKLGNSCDENCGLLLLLTVSGIPCPENNDFRFWMTVAEVVVFSLLTLEISKNIVFRLAQISPF